MIKKLICLLLSLVFFSCATMGSLVSDLQSSMTRSGTDSEEVSEEPEETQTAETSEESSFDMSMFLGPELQFGLVYASYFMLGGYGFGEDNFRDGEGIRWSVTSNQDDKEIVVTRARLKTLGDGSAWWSLRGAADGDEYYYEMQIDKEFNVLNVRYRNPDTGAIDQFSLDPSSDEEEYETFDESDYSPFIVGNEQIRTKAGSFKADHIVMEDPESNGRYEYWIADRVPGYSVKYRFENTEENQIFTGELVDIRGGYRTELDSY